MTGMMDGQQVWLKRHVAGAWTGKSGGPGASDRQSLARTARFLAIPRNALDRQAEVTYSLDGRV